MLSELFDLTYLCTDELKLATDFCENKKKISNVAQEILSTLRLFFWKLHVCC